MVQWLHRYVFRGLGTFFVLFVLVMFCLQVSAFLKYRAQGGKRPGPSPHTGQTAARPAHK